MTRIRLALASTFLIQLFISSCADQNNSVDDTLTQRINEIDNRLINIENRLEENSLMSNSDRDNLKSQMAEVFQERVNASSGRVFISKKLLYKDLYLTRMVFSGVKAANPNALPVKIVSMQSKKDAIIINESQSYNYQTTDNAQPLFLMSLPIIEELSDGYLVDFTKDLKNVDFGGYGEPSVLGSYVSREFHANESSNFTVSMKQLTTSKDNKKNINYLAVKYSFSRVPDSSSFEKVTQKNIEKYGVGYFLNSNRNNPEYDGLAKIWDVSKSHTFYYSNNFPPKYIELLEASVDYWNVAYKKKVFSLERLPAKAEIGDAGYNVFQWNDFKNGGYAYAILVASPATGEMIQGNFVVPSSFIRDWVGLGFFKNDLANVEPRKITVSDSLYSDPSYQCKDHAHVDSVEAKGVFKSLIGAYQTKLTNQNDLTKPELEKRLAAFSQKVGEMYLLGTLTHEIGHLVGLRHNFVSSLSNEIDPIDREKIVIQAYNDPSYIFPKIGTSIMEYPISVIRMLRGFQVMQKRVFEYDQYAINAAYSKDTVKKDILFCTDGDVSKYIDCARSDDGPISHKAYYHSYIKSIQNAVSSSLEKYLLTGSNLRQAFLSNLKTLTVRTGFMVNLLNKDNKFISGYKNEDLRKSELADIPGEEGFVLKLVVDMDEMLDTILLKARQNSIEKIENQLVSESIEITEEQKTAILDRVEGIDGEIKERKPFISEALKTLLVGSLVNVKIDVSDPESFSELLKDFFTKTLISPQKTSFYSNFRKRITLHRPLSDAFYPETRVNTAKILYKGLIEETSLLEAMLGDTKSRALRAQTKAVNARLFERALKIDPFNEELLKQLDHEKAILKILESGPEEVKK